MASIEPGTRIRKTTETEVLPSSAKHEAFAAEFYDRDFWEVIGDIGRQHLWRGQNPEKGHQVRIYRADDRWEKGAALEGNKFIENFNEETIRAKWGGGRYLLWLYGPPDGTKLVATPFKLELEGAQKIPVAAGGAPVSGTGIEALIQLMMEQQRQLIEEMRAARGGSLAADAMKNALEIQAMGMKSAIQMQAPMQGPHQPSRMDAIIDQMFAALVPALISKFTNPANPIDELGKVAEAVKNVANMLGGGDKAGKPDTLGTVIQALPGVIDRAVNGMKEYRLSMEAQERAIRIQAGSKVIDVQPTQTQSTPADGAAPSQPAQMDAPNPAPAATPAAPQNLPPEVVTVMFDELIFHKIVERIQNNADCTGEDLYEFIEATVPQYVEELAKHSREEIILFFRSNRILAAIADHPRLPQIVDQFLETAKGAK